LMLNDRQKGKLTIDKSRLSNFDLSNLGNFYPAILLPYRDKDEFTMPPTHYYQLDHYFSYIENLFVIGWKGNEALFNKVLNQKATKIKKIVIVDPNSKTVVDNLKSILVSRGIKPIVYNNFDDFVRNGLDKEIN